MANKLIYASDARRAILKEDPKLAYCIDDIPGVDAVEVRHGRWLYDSGSGEYFCSACDEKALSFRKDTICGGELYEVCLTDYCPNCGADMRGDNDGK